MHIDSQSMVRRAVTLTELLVVVVIISLLATIAVPVYVNKAEQAKISVAREETKTLAHAEEAVASIHQVYVPLQMLDNLPYDPDTSSPLNPRSDDMENEFQDLGMIYANRPLLAQVANQALLQDRNSPNSDHYVEMRDLFENWAGPFLNPRRVAFERELQQNIIQSETPAVQYDFPLDPWGVPYRFYSPLGVIGTDGLTRDVPVGDNAGTWGNFSDGQLTTQDDRFAKYAIVSYGPDGLTEFHNTDADTDDIIYEFGAVFTVSSYNAFR
ncbi:prepilin-type N-terminal cleavage/methylation domain-containing protein [bacterium]|nr:prepilin-type N-terminal cleavage/methylation domain-containing protein [bacterium]